MVFTSAIPAYADEVKEPKAAYEAITCEAEVSEGVAEEAVEANYDSVTPFDGENEAVGKSEKDSE